MPEATDNRTSPDTTWKPAVSDIRALFHALKQFTTIVQGARGNGESINATACIDAIDSLGELLDYFSYSAITRARPSMRNTNPPPASPAPAQELPMNNPAPDALPVDAAEIRDLLKTVHRLKAVRDSLEDDGRVAGLVRCEDSLNDVEMLLGEALTQCAIHGDTPSPSRMPEPGPAA